jgi:RNA polymerase sigma-70 factor (ECF subfamily)
MTLDVDAETREARLAMRGDPLARERLFEQIYGRVLRYHRKLAAGSPGLAEELTQETMVRIIRSFDQLREPGRFVPWAFRIATNVWRDYHRPRRTPPTPLPDAPSGPVRAPEREELAQRVLELLNRLPDTYRIVLTLRYLEGLDYESIAAILDIAVPTLRSQIARGRQMIRRLLGEDA